MLLACLALVVAATTAAVHWPALSTQAISFDDNQYLVENRLVRNPSWASTGRFLTEVLAPSTVGGYYQPLTMISLMVDYAGAGRVDDLRPFHRTSLVLHVLNTTLNIILLYILFGRAIPAALLGLLFGLHPLTVEPVAWVSERKTLLAAFFALWTLLSYVRYAQTRRRAWYVLALVTLVLALMSKPTTTPLPLLLLLLDFWPLRRFSRTAMLEKLPFLVLAGTSAVITFISQKTTAGVFNPAESSLLRIPLTLCHNIVFYPWKMLWPVNLSSHYPVPKPMVLSQPMVLAGVVGAAILIPFLLASLRRTPALLTGWLFFFVAILPTMGIIGFTDVIASDKYVYLPVTGLLMIAAWGLGHLWKLGDKELSLGNMAAAAVTLGLAAGEAHATRAYLPLWADTIKYSRYMLSLAPQCAQLHNHLADPLGMMGQLDEAIEHFREAVRLQPSYAEARYNLGAALRLRGDIDEALPYLEQAVRDKPKNALAQLNLGLALQAQGRLAEAAVHLREAARLKPEDLLPHYSLGQVLQSLGELDQAVSCFREALRLSPDNVEARVALAGVLASQGKIDEAVSDLQQVLRIKPDDPDANTVLGGALASQGKIEEAVVHFRAALAAKPDHAGAHYNLGLALQREGKIEESVSHYRDAIRVRPNFAEAHYALGLALVRSGGSAEGLAHYREAAILRPNWPAPLQAAAQLMATSAEAGIRQEQEALALAQRAAELTRYQDAGVLDTLAVAYASVQDFDQAVSVARQALTLATTAKDDRMAAGIAERLRRYEQRMTPSASQPAGAAAPK